MLARYSFSGGGEEFKSALPAMVLAMSGALRLLGSRLRPIEGGAVSYLIVQRTPSETIDN